MPIVCLFVCVCHTKKPMLNNTTQDDKAIKHRQMFNRTFPGYLPAGISTHTSPSHLGATRPSFPDGSFVIPILSFPSLASHPDHYRPVPSARASLAAKWWFWTCRFFFLFPPFALGGAAARPSARMSHRRLAAADWRAESIRPGAGTTNTRMFTWSAIDIDIDSSASPAR